MKKVHHMVLVKFKPQQEPQAPALLEALAALRKTIPGIVHYAGGAYSSPEGLNQGFTHGFLFTFADAKARNTYLTHPEHEAVKDKFLPFVENVVAFDFEE